MRLSQYNAYTEIVNNTVVTKPKLAKVAIVAADPSHELAPFEDCEWEVWGCNSLWRICQDTAGHFRADRWFEMHPMSVQTDDELRAIARCPIPIYHLGDATYEQAPMGVPYPLEAVLNRFRYRYFTCTFAYQIALALLEGFTTIGLFGVELDRGSSRERMVEKACVEFWMGLALGMGVNIITPQDSHLTVQEHLYGYQYHQEVDEVNAIVDGVFFRRIGELEKQGLAERIPVADIHQEGNA